MNVDERLKSVFLLVWVLFAVSVTVFGFALGIYDIVEHADNAYGAFIFWLHVQVIVPSRRLKGGRKRRFFPGSLYHTQNPYEYSSD